MAGRTGVGAPREPMGGTPAAMRWVRHGEGFMSLMAGRVEMAQVSGPEAAGPWAYCLRHGAPGEGAIGSRATRERAVEVAERHAALALGWDGGDGA